MRFTYFIFFLINILLAILLQIKDMETVLNRGKIQLEIFVKI